MAYNETTKIISDPVSIADLQQCFGTQITDGDDTLLSGDIGVIAKTKNGDTFTVNGTTWTVNYRRDVNKWAKYKPVIRTANGTASSAGTIPLINTYPQRVPETTVGGITNPAHWMNKAQMDAQSMLGEPWWTADDGLCGFSIHMYESFSDFIDDYFGLHEVGYSVLWNWTHVLPGINNPVHAARMLDFVGYNHQASPAVHDFQSDSPMYFVTNAYRSLASRNVMIGAAFNVVQDTDGASLSLMDFPRFKNFYFGVAIVDTTTNELVGFMTNGMTVKNTSVFTLEIPFRVYDPSTGTVTREGIPLPGNAETKTYKAAGFLSEQPHTSFSKVVESIGNVFSIGLPATTFSVAHSGEWIDVKIESTSKRTDNYVYVHLTFTTYRVLSQGNIQKSGESDKNHVRVIISYIKGKFENSGPGMADDQLGEPYFEIPGTLYIGASGTETSYSYIDIPCRTAEQTKSSVTINNVRIPNDPSEIGTGSGTQRLKWVLLSARVNHDTWNTNSGDGTFSESTDNVVLAENNS